MARTIDERIVQMTFNNSDFEQKAGTTIQTLEKLKSATDFAKTINNFGGLQTALSRIDLTSLNAGVTRVTQSFSALESIAIGSLMRIGQKVTDVGTNLVKSLTIQQPLQGWNKYNEQTQSVQTLVNSTGKSVEEIDGYLSRLMWYSDETSFSFTEMTKALSTMVSSGGKIDSLIPMIMGIGNATAYAGKSGAEFQRVIYNLNQSYSQGFLNRQDWKSIELAGVDSKVLKEQLMGAAVQLGTIKKSQADIAKFNDLLTNKVFTRDVMEKAFGSFAQMTLEAEKLVTEGKFDTAAEAIESLSGKYEEFAERAFKSAQEAKSFQEAIDATKDAVSSGWMQTFKIIFGNYNESKALWTDLTNTFWEIFASGAAKRNDILSAWKDIWTDAYQTDNPMINSREDYERWEKNSQYLTQTQALLAAISDLVLQIRDDISMVFESVFPFPTIVDETGKGVENFHKVGQKIFSVIEKVRKAFIDIREIGLNGEVGVALRNTLRAILQTIKTIIEYGKVFKTSLIDPLKTALEPVLKEVVALFNNLAKIISNTAVKARQDMTPFENLLSGILKIAQPLISAVQAILHWINELLSGVEGVSFLDGVFKAIGNIANFVGNVFKGTVSVLGTLGKLLKDIFSNLRDTVINFIEGHGTDVAKFAEGGFLGYIIVGITKIVGKLKKLDLPTILQKVSDFFNGGDDGPDTGIMAKVENMFDTLTSSIQKFTDSIKIKILDTISNSLIKLAASLLIISLIDSDKITTALLGLGMAIGELMAAVAVTGKITDSGSMFSASKSFGRIATGLVAVAIALKIMSGIDPNAMSVTIAGLGVVLLELSAFLMVLGSFDSKAQGKNMPKIAKSLTSIGLAMILFGAAFKIMGSLDWTSMVKGFVAMGAVLGEIAIFMIAIGNFTNDRTLGGNKIKAIGDSMVRMAVSLAIIGVAMKIMASIDGKGVDLALAQMTAAFVAIGAFTIVVSKFAGGLSFIAVSTGMLIMSVALIALAGAIATLGSLQPKTVGNGLKVMAMGIGALAIAALVLGGLAGFFVLAAAGLAAFAVALKFATDAIIAAVPAFAAFEIIGAGIGDILLKIFATAIETVILLIPQFIISIVQAILKGLTQIKDLIVQFLDLVISTITEVLPKIIGVVLSILFAVLAAIRDNIKEFTVLAFDILTEFLKGLSEGLPDFLNSLLEFFGNVINGLADAIRSNAGSIGAALGNLASAIIEGILSALVGFAGSFVGGVLEFFGDSINKVADWLNGTSSAEATGEQIVDGAVTGVETAGPKLVDAATDLGEDSLEALDVSDKSPDVSRNIVDGMLNYIADAGVRTDFYNKWYDFAGIAETAMNNRWEIRSPSKVAMAIGRYIVDGLAAGIDDEENELESSIYGSGSALINAIETAVKNATDVLNDDLNPVIAPVLDLSNVRDNAALIPGLLGTDSSYNAAMMIGGNYRNMEIQNGVLNEQPIVMTNNFTLNGVGNIQDPTVLNNLADRLADKINTILGNAL